MNKESKESIFSLDHQMAEGENDEEERLSTCSCSTNKSSGSESPKSAEGSVIATEQVRSVSECSPTIAEERHFKMISGTTV